MTNQAGVPEHLRRQAHTGRPTPGECEGDAKSEIVIKVVIEAPVADWLEAARGGSLKSLGQALEYCRPFLHHVAENELGTDLRCKEGVSDLVQQTFFEAYRDFQRFSGRTEGEWRAWLRSILRNNLQHIARRYRMIAKRKISQEVSLEQLQRLGGPGSNLVADSSSPSGHAIKNERIAVIQQALDRLPEKDRQALSLRIREHCTFEQMGERMGCSAVSARKNWLRAIERLREELSLNSRSG